MDADAQRQLVFLACPCPLADDVAPGSHAHGVPFLIGRIPEVEVVMVLPQRKEKLRPTLLVELHQRLGIPSLGLPGIAEILHAEVSGRAIVLHMILVLPAAFLVHAAAVPVARLCLALRSPMRPDAELGIAEPFGALPRFQALPIGREGAVFHGDVALRLRLQRQGGCDDQGHGRNCSLHTVSAVRFHIFRFSLAFLGSRFFPFSTNPCSAPR